MPFAKHLDIELVTADRDQVVGRMAWADRLCTAGGLLHGGALMSLADSTGALVAFLNLPDGSAGTTTVSSATQFTRGLRTGTATATSRPLHRGRSTIVVETDVRDDAGKLLGRVTQTQAVLF
ncbi:MAG: PaaI family thioesterase [Sciscionella sp.]|nr:PaaI family thioesterase [Sciscionella sp.]